MNKHKLGNSNVEVTPVTFGAWAIGGWMWGGADRNDAIAAIQTCLDHGISTIDTAPIYGFGVSEEIVGEAIRGKRDQYEILTKYGMRWEGTKGEFFFNSVHNDGREVDVYKYASRESIINECEESLRRLGTDYIDLYQIHWPDGTTPIAETMEAVGKLIEQGKVRAAGVCNYSVDQMAEAADAVKLSTNQVPYSMVRRNIEEDVVPWCIGNNCGILAYSPLQRGLLTGKITPDYKFNKGDTRPDLPHFSRSNILKVNQFLNDIKPVADDKGVSISQLVIRWTIQQPGVTAALVGARNPGQVIENAVAQEFVNTDDEMKIINGALEKLELDL